MLQFAVEMRRMVILPWNYQLIDEESTGGRVILPRTTSSWMRYPPEEWLFCQELLAHGRGIHQRNGYSAWNYQLMDDESTGGMGFLRESPAHGPARSKWAKNPLTSNNFRISNYKYSLPQMYSVLKI
jgi:hypothetical protein